MNNSGIDKRASVIKNKADSTKDDIKVHKQKSTAINPRKKMAAHYSDMVKCLVPQFLYFCDRILTFFFKILRT